MKAKISLAAIVMAGFILFAACGSTSSSTSSSSSSPAQSAGYQSGAQVGTSLLSLYSQYKAAGNKIDFNNMNTYLQLLTLATNVQTIKNNAKNGTFYTQFAQGAMSSSQSIINNKNVNGVFNLLSGLDLSGIVSAGSASNITTATANTVVNNLSGIFALFGK